MNVYDIELYEESGGYARQFVRFARMRDALGYEWVYDSSRSRELRMPETDSTPQNGYYAESFEQAIVILINGGYI